MSSKIERAYLGVSVNDFLMEVKPIFFKQNQIIKSDLILLPVGVVLYIVNAYWTLLLFFAISLILVQVSVNEVYEVFLGTEKIDEEIKAYLLDGTEEKSKPIMKKSVNQKMIDLTDQWEKEITTQPEYLYNDYCKVFDKLFDSSFDDKDCRKRLQDQCEKIVLALLSIGTDNLTFRAANFLNNCYECINNYLLKTKHDNEIIKFHLFHNVCEELRTEFSGIKLSKMLRRFNWTGFVKTVIFDSVSLENAENPFKCLDIWSTNELFYTMGSIYAITEKGGVDTERLFLEIIAEDYTNLNARLKKSYDIAIAECFNAFLLSLVDNVRYDFIEKCWYKNLDCIFDKHNVDPFIYSAIKLHCYIYYLTRYDRKLYIDVGRYDAAHDFIMKPEIADEFGFFIRTIGRDGIFFGNLYKKLWDDLCGLEFPIGYFNTRKLIMGKVILDFVVFLSCLIAEDLNDNVVFTKVLEDKKQDKSLERYITENHSDDLHQFFIYMGYKDDASVLNTNSASFRAERAYELLTNYIKEDG